MSSAPTPERETPDPVEEAVEVLAEGRALRVARARDLPTDRELVLSILDAFDSPEGRRYLLSRALTEEQREAMRGAIRVWRDAHGLLSNIGDPARHLANSKDPAREVEMIDGKLVRSVDRVAELVERADFSPPDGCRGIGGFDRLAALLSPGDDR